MTPPARITETFAVREVPGRSRGGRQLVKLLEPLEYRVGSAESGQVIVVPCGFVTDFASIPWGLRNTFPPLGPHARAAIVHDFLYAVQGRLRRAQDYLGEWGWTRRDGFVHREERMLSPSEMAAYAELVVSRPEVNARDVDRAEADAIFREALEVVGVGVVRRNLMYRAVRLGGGGGWGF